jgi:hypothetical protein
MTTGGLSYDALSRQGPERTPSQAAPAARGGEDPVMQPLVDGHPGADESWEELAEHSLTHDDLPPDE